MTLSCRVRDHKDHKDFVTLLSPLFCNNDVAMDNSRVFFSIVQCVRGVHGIWDEMEWVRIPTHRERTMGHMIKLQVRVILWNLQLIPTHLEVHLILERLELSSNNMWSAYALSHCCGKTKELQIFNWYYMILIVIVNCN